MQVQPLGREDPLEEGMAAHSSILAWRIPMDRGAWPAAVHGVTKSRRPLKPQNTRTDVVSHLHDVHYSRRRFQAVIVFSCHVSSASTRTVSRVRLCLA